MFTGIYDEVEMELLRDYCKLSILQYLQFFCVEIWLISPPSSIISIYFGGQLHLIIWYLQYVCRLYHLAVLCLRIFLVVPGTVDNPTCRNVQQGGLPGRKIYHPQLYHSFSQLETLHNQGLQHKTIL